MVPRCFQWLENPALGGGMAADTAKHGVKGARRWMHQTRHEWITQCHAVNVSLQSPLHTLAPVILMTVSSSVSHWK